MKIHQLKELFSRSGFSLRASSTDFLMELESMSEGRIRKLHDFIEGYHHREGISLYRYMNFLLMVIEREIKLPMDMMETLSDCFIHLPIDPAQVIKKFYHRLWQKLEVQTDSLMLTYHNGYHGLEVSMRTMAGIDELGLFVADDLVNQFLRCLLLIGAKYHDYIQWTQNHVIDDVGYHTAEEQTAMTLIPIVIDVLRLSELPLDVQAPIVQFVEAFFPLMIGPGTMPVFGPRSFFNLSHHYFELRKILSIEASAYPAGKTLSYQLLVALEVLNIADKAAISCPAMINREYALKDASTEAYVVPSRSQVMTFLGGLDRHALYYPEQDMNYNFYVFSMAKVSQLQMQLELNRGLPEASRLRRYIRTGQELYLSSSEDLGRHLNLVFTKKQIFLDFQSIYIDRLMKEIHFFNQLSHVCHHTIDRLQSYRCLDEFGAPLYQLAKRFVSILHDGVVDGRQRSVDEGRDEIDSLLPPFMDPEVPKKEAMILGGLMAYWTELSEMGREKLCQELLFFSMTQPGVYYTNHPDCIGGLEPGSPLSQYRGVEPLPMHSGFARTPYGSFSNLTSLGSRKELYSSPEPESSEIGRN